VPQGVGVRLPPSLPIFKFLPIAVLWYEVYNIKVHITY
jgi:hypothetical protein